VIFGLAKILRSEKFGQTNDLRALFRRVANELNRAFKILFRLRAAPHLDERDLCQLHLRHSGINHEGHEVHQDVTHFAIRGPS
jgi:hypothetical protein